MCIIAIKPRNTKMFTFDQIKTMFTNNPDGAGYAYYDSDTKSVCIRKGFTSAKELYKDLHAHTLYSVGVVLHFRIGTSGVYGWRNCHPFSVYGNNSNFKKEGKIHTTHTKVCVAHNGILHNYEPEPYDVSGINDTQIFINEVLSKLDENFLQSRDKKMLIQQIIGSNKLAFINSDGSVKTIGQFIKDGSYYYSNNSYIVPRSSKPSVHTFYESTLYQMKKNLNK